MSGIEKEIKNQGKFIINQLTAVLRTGLLHEVDNVAVGDSIDRLLKLAAPYLETEGELTVQLKGEFFYLNDTIIRYPLEFMINFEYLANQFRRRELGLISFASAVNKNDLKKLLRAFSNAADSNNPLDDMLSVLDEANNVQIDKLKEIKEDSEELDRRRLVKKTYFNAVSFTKDVMTRTKAGDKVSIRKANWVVRSLVDAILQEQQFILGMTSIKDYDEYTFHHSVNVSILSIAIGQKIGLSRQQLKYLGLISLFHDLGKTGIPVEMLNKPAPFTKEEWKIVQRHPYLGALSILKIKEIDEISIKTAIVAFQHHMNYDHSGYPKVRKSIPLDFFARIVTIADRYDAMTSSRVYSRKALSPDEALSIMMERCGVELDPILYKVFVNLIGVYPIGSLVLLDTREMGLVCECNYLDSARPKVRLVVDGTGKRISGPVVELSEKDAEGRYFRSIAKTLDPNKYRINLAEYLL